MLFLSSYIPQNPLEAPPKEGEERPVEFNFLNNKVSRETVYFCRKESKKVNGKMRDIYMELGSHNFMTALRKSKRKEVVLFIHGFNNEPDKDTFPNAAKLQRLFDKQEKERFEVVPVIWPCDDDFGIAIDYRDDQFHASQAAAPFSRALALFLQWFKKAKENEQCVKKVHIIAHSMGNRALMFTLNTWCRKEFNGADLPSLFQTIVNMAADIPNEALEKGEEGWLITRAANEVVVFHSANDLALKSSKVVNTTNGVFSRRLGDTGPENMTRMPNHVYAIDCINYAQKYDEKGHTYFYGKDAPGEVCKALFNVLSNGASSVTNREKIFVL